MSSSLLQCSFHEWSAWTFHCHCCMLTNSKRSNKILFLLWTHWIPGMMISGKPILRATAVERSTRWGKSLRIWWISPGSNFNVTHKPEDRRNRLKLNTERERNASYVCFTAHRNLAHFNISLLVIYNKSLRTMDSFICWENTRRKKSDCVIQSLEMNCAVNILY